MVLKLAIVVDVRKIFGGKKSSVKQPICVEEGMFFTFAFGLFFEFM